MESAKTCQICFLDYDSKDNSPRCLPCGHIMCPKCLTNILNDPNLRKCPFDKIAFLPSQNSLASFPVSYAIKDILEQRKSNTCKAHPEEKVKFFCLTDETRICFECTREKEHQGHKVKKIKALKAQGAKIKANLQETLLSVTNYEQEKDDDLEQIRKVFISTIDEQVKEVNNFLAVKQFEWVQLVNNLFNANKKHDSESHFAFKQEIGKTMENMTHACQDENGDLMRIEREAHHAQNITEKQTQFIKEKSSRVQHKVLEIQKYLKETIADSKMTIDSLQLPTHEIFREMHSMREDKDKLSEEELTKRHKKLTSFKFMSHFKIEIDSGCLEIFFEHSRPKELQIDLVDFQSIEKINLHSIRCDMLKNEPYPDAISSLFHRLKKLVDLRVSFHFYNFNNEGLLWVANNVQRHAHHLKSFHIDLRYCEFDNKSLSILCDMILSKAINIESLGFDFFNWITLDVNSRF